MLRFAYVARNGAWLKVPLGKMHTEHMVPLSQETVALFDSIVGLRGKFRALPHRETGKLADFLLVRRGRRVSPEYIRRGLAQAVYAAGFLDEVGKPLAITPHRLRHTFATSLINGGISVQADAAPGPRNNGDEPTLRSPF
jgi:integrase